MIKIPVDRNKQKFCVQVSLLAVFAVAVVTVGGVSITTKIQFTEQYNLGFCCSLYHWLAVAASYDTFLVSYHQRI